MSECNGTRYSIDEMVALLERRIKRTEAKLNDEQYKFEWGREMRLTGIDI